MINLRHTGQAYVEIVTMIPYIVVPRQWSANTEGL